jgi:hypothetical protein
VVNRQTANEELLEEQKETLRIDLLRQKQNQAYTDWFEGIRRAAKIEDYRDRFFRG